MKVKKLEKGCLSIKDLLSYVYGILKFILTLDAIC